MIEHRLHARCGCASGVGGARPFTLHGTPRNFERDRPFLVQHLALDVTLFVEKKSIKARCTLSVRRVDADAEAIVLDAIGFDIHKVTVDGKPAKHRYDGRAITIDIAKAMQNAKIEVEYSATPRRGMYFIEPDAHYPNRPRQVWTQCQEEDARHFIPCHDKPHVKMTTEIRATVPNGWSVLSNGELAEKQTPTAGAWTFHWKMKEPHSSYLITLVAGEFDVIEATATTSRTPKLPVSYWIPKGRKADGDRTFSRTPDMISHFSELFGVPYPWNKYAQVVVVDFIFGGMENTTATTMYEHIMLDERAAIDITSDDIIAHELAHQWFGDYLTCRDWSEGWLNEGFATFMEQIWREKHLGRDEYDYAMKTDLDSYVGEATGRYRRPIVCQDFDSPLDLFDRHLYEKGCCVLHLLRCELGDAAFWRGIQLYLTRHQKSIVETRDLMRALEEDSGKSLGRFFEQWLYKPGHPELEVDLAWDKGILVVSVRQSHSSNDGVPAAFDLPLAIDVVAEGGETTRKTLHVTHKTESFAVPCADRPSFVVVDPEMRVLGEVTTKAPADMLRTQLVHAPTARGRWLAAPPLSKVDDPATIEALAARLEDKKEFWGVRAECAEALSKIRAKESFDVLLEATKIEHPKVRRAVVAALGQFKTVEAADALKPIALRDASYLVESEASRALGKTKQAQALDVLVDVIDRPAWADVISVGAIDGLAALRDDRGVPHVLARTRYGHPTRARRAAIMAMPKLATDRKAREALEDLLEDPDPYLRVDVARALGELGDAKARPALRSRLDVDLDPRVRRRIREVLRDLGGDGKKGLDNMREQVDRLETMHAELRARIAKLEAQEPEAKKPEAKKPPKKKKR